MELFNWGTFHGKVWSLNPQAGWTLLVGDNGSGKSTAVDGLRTLLVPPRLLNYNDASGNASRRDRSRVSYIRGAWAATSAEDSHLAKTEYLREEGELSLVLAVFRQGGAGRAVTLAQVLWAADTRPEELFLVADGERTIREHLAELKGGKRELRAELRKRTWDVHDSFTAYSARFRPLLGIVGDGALEVFNQAIGVKEVQDVNQFVRRHLLEPGDALAFVRDTLTPLYRELLGCWERIQRAEQQIARLRPIADAHAKAEEARTRISEINRLLALVRPYYCDTERRLRRELAQQLADERLRLEGEKAALSGEQENDQQTRDQIRAELDAGEIGLRLKSLELEIAAAETVAKGRESALKTLQAHLQTLGESTAVPDASILVARQRRWSEQRPLLEGNRAAQQEKQLRQLQLRQASEDEAKRVKASIDSLKEHRVNIDDGFLQVRALIAQEAKVPLEALPFAGELMEVPLEFREWTGAIERLLRGFGLSLLVSERNYDAVTRAINRRHWGVRLQYFRVPVDAPRDAGRPVKGGQLVADRLAFRDGHALSPWVAAEVRRAFPHVCCADEAELAREPYAITREGLMRSGTRHVKDDRRHVDDAASYVLGWSVEDKLRALSKRLVELQGAVGDSAAKAAEAGREVTRLERQLAAVEALVAVAVFDTIDLVGAQRTILKLRGDYEELEKSSDRRKQLKKQLGEVERALKERREALDALQSSLGKNESVTDGNAGRLRAVEEELAPHGDLSFAEFGEVFAELRDGVAPVLERLDAQRDGAEKRLRGRVDRQNAIVRESLKEMLPAMTAFLGEYRDFEKSLSPKEEFAADFVALLNRVEREELPAHKNRFEEYLNTNLVGNMAMFNSRLDEQLDAMRSRIAAVNASLRSIDFTGTTYVQIVDRVVGSGEIGPFKARLRECIAGGINPSAEDRVRIFHVIRALLDEFSLKPDWAERVTDVRNWLEFGVRELARADDRQVDYFAASSGKSGGQKARLAFSILASAIISQYGLTVGGTSSADTFRLVVIDEVFSRTDEENSRRALDLFQKLGLQMIVVSPFDAKARIVEDYVASYHVALNPNRNSSSLQRATREQYEQAWQEADAPRT